MNNKRNKGVLLVHLGGNMNVRGALRALNNKSLLAAYITTVAVFKGTWYYPFLSWGLFNRFKRREYNRDLRIKTITHPVRTLLRMFFQSIRINRFYKNENSPFSPQRDCISLDMYAASFIEKNYSKILGVYSYEDMAFYSFIAAKKHDVKCIYEEPTGYWRAKVKILNEESLKNPDWVSTLNGLKDSEEKLFKKDEEIRNADLIVVASTFTKNTLKYYPGSLPPIEVVPYGFPTVNIKRVYSPISNRKVKALFVGSLSQQKGLSYLFEAWSLFKEKIDLTVIGTGNLDVCEPLQNYLQQVNYIKYMSHDELIGYMSNQDLFVFPSLFDGFGMVVTEAMSQGTPCIATSNSCGPDVITNNYDGWVINAGDSQGIKDVFSKIVNDPTILPLFGRRAMEKASQRPWSCYERDLIEVISKHI